MSFTSKPHPNRRVLRSVTACVTGAALVTTGSVALSGPAAAATQQNRVVEVNDGSTSWAEQAYECTPTGAYLTPQQDNTATRADYAAMIEAVDQGVSKILQALQRLGLTENTIVIFTNDNGGEWLSRNAPLYHRKGTLWEGGIRVPLIMRWPGVLPAGRTSAQVAITMDLTATLLAATGTPAPPEYRPDGIDLLPLLKAGAVRERTLVWRIARCLFRHPLVTLTMIECYFIEQSWDWQFRGDDPPMKLLRHTWRRNSAEIM